MQTRRDDWEAVWAEYDARSGAPRIQAHTPWYMDADYVHGPAAAPPPLAPRARPLLAMASVAVVFLAFMLNIRLVPEPPPRATAWQPPVEAAPPTARFSLGSPAEAAPRAEPAAPEGGFGPLLEVPAPAWVQPASPARPAATPAEAAPRQAPVASPRARPLRQARVLPALAATRARTEDQAARLASAAALLDRLCAAPALRQHASAPAPRRAGEAAAAAAGQAKVATAARAGKPQPTLRAARSQPAGSLALAGAPRAPPGAAARG